MVGAALLLLKQGHSNLPTTPISARAGGQLVVNTTGHGELGEGVPPMLRMLVLQTNPGTVVALTGAIAKSEQLGMKVGATSGSKELGAAEAAADGVRVSR